MVSSTYRTNKISVIIPIFLIFLMIGALVGIIGNSILLNSSESVLDSNFVSSSQSKEFRIFKIVVSSILTLLFLLMVIFSFVEIFEPGNYKARIFTPKLDSWIEGIYNNFESWELLLILSNYIILPVGLATALIGGGEEFFILSGIFIVIVYFSYSQRIGTRKAIRAALPANKTISLVDLSKLISKDPKTVRKAIVHMVSFEN
ncbi:MAG: hypothetical protein ACXAC2_17405, partial [Candidatus Kariarchaeaceae archaeon]